MRILMVVPKYPLPIVGGLERQAHLLAKTLRARGHEISAVSTRFDPSQRPREDVDDVIVYRDQLWSDDAKNRFTTMPLRLWRRMAAIRRHVDVVHVHNVSWFGGFVTACARVLGLPVLTKLPNVGEYGIPGIRAQRLGGARIALLKCSDAIVAMTEASHAELREIGFPASRVLAVTNGIPVDLPRPQPRPEPAIVRFVFTGRLVPQKGLPDLLTAWSDVVRRISRRAQLVLVGDGPQREELVAQAAALGISDSVRFAGFTHEISSELERADAFVLPSLAEGNSNAILEAMRAGLPIVATDVGGTRMQVGRDGERLIVAPRDVAGLVRCLVEVIEAPAMRRELGARMRTRIEETFDIEVVATRYERAYELLIRGQREHIAELGYV